jgi:hypothetical protein
MAQQQRCRVLRGFRHKAEIYGPGSVLDLDKPLAVELRTANKLEFVASDEKLVQKTGLPDPNRVLADRQAARAAATASTAKAAAAAAGAK